MGDDPEDALLTFNFANIPTLDSLAALSREEAAARWLQAQDARWHMHRARERNRKRGCDTPADVSPLRLVPRRVLGSVVRDSSVAYVLHELAHPGRGDVAAAVHSEPPLVVLLQRRGDRWEILPREGLVGSHRGASDFVLSCVPVRPPR